MSDQVLTLLKFGLLALLYVFFARTLWAVWSEVRSSDQAGTSGGRAKTAGPSVQPASVQPAGRQNQPDEQPAIPPTPPVPAGALASSSSAAAGRSHAEAASGAKAVEHLPSGNLVVVEPVAQTGVSYPLGKELTIGRAPGCGVLIDDTFVSQLHARVWTAGGTWMVEDLGSTNGTVFNGDLLTEPKVMKMGDQIRLGSTVLELR